MKVAIYARVSTKDKGQDTENQLSQLRAFAVRSEYELVNTYVDNVSGGGKTRPAFEEMFLAAYQKQFDLVLFWSLDRFSREGVQKTFEHLQKLNTYKVKWKSYTEQFLDSSGPFGDAIIAIFACIAQQERIRLTERVQAGMDRVKVTGITKSGLAVGRPKVIFRRDKAIELWQQRATVREIAQILGVSSSVVHRAVKGVPKPSGHAIPFGASIDGPTAPL